MTEPFAKMTQEEAERFMSGPHLSIREEMRTLVAYKTAGRFVCDLGCGKGILVSKLYSQWNYHGIDCSPELIKIAKRDNPHYSFECCDLFEFLKGQADNALECAIMVAVLEHQPSQEIAVRLYDEARRCSQELIVGWHTAPQGDITELKQVKAADLDNLIWQNRYRRSAFGGNIQSTNFAHKGSELWSVRS